MLESCFMLLYSWHVFFFFLFTIITFCFQKDNVANQHEHVVHLLANEQSRLRIPDEVEPVSHFCIFNSMIFCIALKNLGYGLWSFVISWWMETWLFSCFVLYLHILYHLLSEVDILNHEKFVLEAGKFCCALGWSKIVVICWLRVDVCNEEWC